MKELTAARNQRRKDLLYPPRTRLKPGAEGIDRRRLRVS